MLRSIQVLTGKRQRGGVTLLRRCPVSGAQLSPTDHTGNFIYMLFQMDAGVGKNLQTGTFRTAAQVRRTRQLRNVPAPVESRYTYRTTR